MPMIAADADEDGLRVGRKAWIQITAPLAFVFVEDVSGTRRSRVIGVYTGTGGSKS